MKYSQLLIYSLIHLLNKHFQSTNCVSNRVLANVDIEPTIDSASEFMEKSTAFKGACKESNLKYDEDGKK